MDTVTLEDRWVMENTREGLCSLDSQFTEDDLERYLRLRAQEEPGASDNEILSMS
jgi:hypothetical protein